MKTTKETLTIIFCGIELTVSGTYTPEEPQVRYYDDMSGYPGASSEFDINSVQINGVEINDILSEDQFDEIAEICIQNIEE